MASSTKTRIREVDPADDAAADVDDPAGKEDGVVRPVGTFMLSEPGMGIQELTLFSDKDAVTAGGEKPFQKLMPGAQGQPHARHLRPEVAQAIRQVKLNKTPGVAETLDWAMSMMALHQDHLDADTVRETLGSFIKDRDDVAKLRGKPVDILVGSMNGQEEEDLNEWIQSVTQRLEREVASR